MADDLSSDSVAPRGVDLVAGTAGKSNRGIGTPTSAVITATAQTTGVEVSGHGALRLHHLFVWPAFALLVALAVWRVCTGHSATRRRTAYYLVAAGIMAGLMAGAGYWGGELLISG